MDCITVHCQYQALNNYSVTTLRILSIRRNNYSRLRSEKAKNQVFLHKFCRTWVNSIKFIADVNVIRLGRLLIMMGFDVCYSSSYSDSEIVKIAEAECRIVLTRDTNLLKRRKIVFAKLIQANLPYDQLVEIINFFGLQKSISFFSRCTACNIKLVAIAKKNVIHLLEPKTKQYFDTFFQCPLCKKVFWKGSHYDNIQKKISSLGISTNH